MVQEMKAKSESLKVAADTQYQEVAVACTNNLATKDTEIANLETSIQLLEATVQELEVDIKQGAFDITMYQIDLQRFGQDLELCQTENTEMSAGFARDIAAYDSAIGAAQRAKLILQAETPTARPQAQLLMQTARHLVAALRSEQVARPPTGRHLRRVSAAVGILAPGDEQPSLAQRGSGEYSPDDGGMARDEHLFDDFDGVSSAADGFSMQVGSVESVVDNILTLFRKYKENLITTQTLTKKDFQETVVSLEQQLATNRQSLALSEETLATKKGTLVSKTQELADTRESYTTTVEFRKKLQTTCDEKAADHQEMTDLRTNEIITLGKAIELLRVAAGDVVAAPQEGLAGAASLLRRRATVVSRLVRVARAMSPQEEGEENDKVLGFLRLEARKIGSVSLDHLASEVEAMVGSGADAGAGATVDASAPVGEDAMTKVKDMIQDLITKLQSEAAGEASHNSWCETELRKNEATQKDAQADIKKQAATEDQLEAALAKLELEIEQLNATLARGDADRVASVEERSATRLENLAAIDDAKQSAVAVEAALAMIEDYYKNASKAVSLIKRKQSSARVQAAQQRRAKQTPNALPDAVTQQSVSGPQLEESQGVVAMLQVVADGYRELEKKNGQKEVEAAAAFTQELTDHDVMMVSADKDQKFKLEMKATYTTELKDTSADLDTSTQALADAKTTYEQLKPPCVTGETFEELAAKREQEVAALQEAYDMLVEFSKEMGYVFLQGVSARRGPASAGALTQRAARPEASNTPIYVTAHAAPAAEQRPSPIVVAAAAVASGTVAAANVTSAKQVAKAVAPTAAAIAHVMTKVTKAHVKGAHVHTQGAAADDPVSDVTALLQGIRDEVASDLAGDTKVYGDTMTWCESSIAASQASIAAANSRDQELMTTMEVSIQGKASLEVELTRLKEELAKEMKSLDQQDTLRDKEGAQFHESEKEMLQAISSLTNALQVLRSRYEGGDARDYAAEKAQLEQDKQDLQGGDAAQGDAIVGENLAASLVGVAGEVKKALAMLPSQEATVLGSLATNPALQDFFARPQDVFPALGDGVSLPKRASLTEFGSKMTASPEGQQIFGILQQLLETFQADLVSAREKEASDASTSTSLKVSKGDQVQALQNSITLKEEQFAKDFSTNANAKEELAYVRESRKTEVEHLMNVQSHCREVEAEFKLRNSTRVEEMKSLDEAMEILGFGGGEAASMDAAAGQDQLAFHAVAAHAAAFHALARPMALPHLAPTLAPRGAAAPRAVPTTPKPRPESIVDAYLNMHKGTVAKPAHPGAAAAVSVARALRSRRMRPIALSARHALVAVRHRPLAVVPVLLGGHAYARQRKELNALAVHASLRRAAAVAAEAGPVSSVVNGALDKVGAMIDKIRDTLLQEKQREVEFHDTCGKEKQGAQMQLARREHDEQTHSNTIARLGSAITEAGSQISEAGDQINQLSGSLAQAASARSEEMTEYSTTIVEQEAQQAKLHQCMQKLARYYGPQLLQTDQDPVQVTTATFTTTRPGGFSRPLTKHVGGGGIMAILGLLVEQSESLVGSMRRAEQDARDAYGVNTADTNAAVADKNREVVVMTATRTNAELEMEQTNAQLSSVQTEIQEITGFLVIVEDKCGWILSNFATSQTARTAQVDNLLQAKQVIRGALTG